MLLAQDFQVCNTGEKRAAGIAVNTDGVISYHKDQGLVSEVFTNEVLDNLPEGNISIGHVRYSTTGGAKKENAQPIVIRHKKGNLAVAHNGNITNALELKQELEEDLKRKRENDINRQKLYKEYLDNQNQLDQLNKLKNLRDDMRPQLIASKNQENYFGKSMKKFFSGDASSNTLLDYEGSSRYLGDSKLRHNPITCPVNDYYYNKYVNKLKKESEVIPAGSSNNYSRENLINNSRDNLINNGQQIFK